MGLALGREADYARRDLEGMAFAVRYHRHILEIFRPYLAGHVVEIGAGDGAVTQLLAEIQPRRITAVEPSPVTYRLLERRAARIPSCVVETIQASLPDLGRPLIPSPDCFLYVNVLEHIEDDRAELERMYAALAPGGYTCLFVPALPSLWSAFDQSVGHVRRYRKHELVATCRAAGFVIEHARYFDWLGVLPWWLRFRALGSTALTPRSVRAYDALAVPVIRVTERLIAPPIGKNIVLVAYKPVAT